MSVSFLVSTAERDLRPRSNSRSIHKNQALGGRPALYDNAMEECRDPLSPINQKNAFDKVLDDAITMHLESHVMSILQSNPFLCERNPIARALWDVWKNNAEFSTIDKIDKKEISSVSLGSLCLVAQQLAIKGHNKNFLESYWSTLQDKKNIREAIFPYHYDSKIFDHVLYEYCEKILRGTGIEIDLDGLIYSTN